MAGSAGRRRNLTERFDRLAHQRIRQPVVTMPSLRLHAQKPRRDQFCEVSAGRLRSDVRAEGELAGRKRAPIQ